MRVYSQIAAATAAAARDGSTPLPRLAQNGRNYIPFREKIKKIVRTAPQGALIVPVFRACLSPTANRRTDCRGSFPAATLFLILD